MGKEKREERKNKTQAGRRKEGRKEGRTDGIMEGNKNDSHEVRMTNIRYYIKASIISKYRNNTGHSHISTLLNFCVCFFKCEKIQAIYSCTSIDVKHIKLFAMFLLLFTCGQVSVTPPVLY